MMRGTREWADRRPSSAALIVYLLLSIADFGWPTLRDPRHYTVGSGADPDLFIWFLAWWPHAIRHGMNPFLTKLVWAPDGVNLAWTTSVPAAALPLAPLTLSVGPVIAFNVASLLAPALAGWTAFLLCRHMTRAYLPALAGGYVFGFSSYELAHLQGHLNLGLTFVVPLVALISIRFYEGAVGATRFVIVMALLLALQFGFSTEIFATATFWGAAAFVIGLAFNSSAGRTRMLRVAGYVVLAYALAGLMLAPYVYYVLQGISDLPGLISSPITYSADLVNYVVPTPLTLLGGRTFTAVSSRFSGNYAEAGAYLGLPLVALIVLCAVKYWAARRTKVLIFSAAAAAAGALGPILHIAGVEIGPTPWALTVYLPLIRQALPARFTLYVTLVAGVMVALWLSDERGKRWQRWTLAALALICLAPDLGAPGRDTWRDVPAFFQSGDFKRLDRNENTIVVPYGYTGDSMLWQAETGMWFPMSGGYLGPLVPRSFSRSFVTYMLYSGSIPPRYRTCLRGFLAVHDVRAIIIAGPDQEAWAWLSSLAGKAGTRTGGVTVYRVPAAVLSGFREAPVCGRFLLDQFGDLVQAAKQFTARGGRLSALTPLRAERMGLLAATYGGYQDAARANWTQVLGWLGPWGTEDVAVGVLGSSGEIAPIIERYRRVAKVTYFPYPNVLSGPSTPTGYGRLVMVFPADPRDK